MGIFIKYKYKKLRSGTLSSLGNSAITRDNGDLGKAETWIGRGRDFGQSFHTQPQRIENVSENATLGPLHGGGGVYLYRVFSAIQGLSPWLFPLLLKR